MPTLGLNHCCQKSPLGSSHGAPGLPAAPLPALTSSPSRIPAPSSGSLLGSAPVTHTLPQTELTTLAPPAGCLSVLPASLSGISTHPETQARDSIPSVLVAKPVSHQIPPGNTPLLGTLSSSPLCVPSSLPHPGRPPHPWSTQLFAWL